MIAAGIECRLELRVAGRSTLPIGTISLTEDVQEGSTLRFQIDADDAPVPSPRDEVVLSFSTPSSSSGENATRIQLWATEVRLDDNGRGRTASVLAADPLFFASRGMQFRSWGGRVSLARLVSAVLASYPNRPDGVPDATDNAPTVAEEWLLQANESGRDFLARVASSLGAVTYWDRDRISIGRCKSGPSQNAGSVRLAFSSDLFRVAEILSPQRDPERFLWVNAATRETAALSPGGQNGGSALRRRIAGTRQPDLSCVGTFDQWPERHWIVECCNASVRLGSELELPAGARGLVTRLDHRFDAPGSYSLRAIVVPPEAWSATRRAQPVPATGPYQAEVTHNDDPLGRGRIRVLLAEDGERRPTPWIPFVPPAAGASTGWHWLPDVGDIVLILADRESPESLYAIGGLRGKDRDPDRAWRSAENAKKVLGARGGIQILLDDRAGKIELVGPAASIALEKDGTVRIKGARLEMEMRDEASVKAGQRVLIDAARIDLGT